jgi:hypothetical protein
LNAYDLKKVKAGILSGRKASMYLPVVRPDRTGAEARQDQDNADNFKGLWLADDFSVSPQVGDLVCRSVMLPALKKVPLRLDFDSENERTCGLRTTSCIGTTIDASLFELPPGMKKVEREAQVSSDYF